MIVLSCGMMKVRVIITTIEQDIAGRGFCAREQVRKRMVIGYDSGTLMYNSPHGDTLIERSKVERLISLSSKEFQNYTMNIFDDVKDSNAKSCNAWIVPAKFDPFCFINDPQYLEKDRTPWMVLWANASKANVEIVKNIVQKSPSDLIQRDMMWVETLQEIARQEKLF